MHEIYYSGFLHRLNTYRPNNKAFECLRFCIQIRRVIQIFLIFGGDSVDAESHFPLTESTTSETPGQLSLSTRNDEIFVNVGASCIDSVDVEFDSALIQLTKSLTPR